MPAKFGDRLGHWNRAVIATVVLVAQPDAARLHLGDAKTPFDVRLARRKASRHQIVKKRRKLRCSRQIACRVGSLFERQRRIIDRDVAVLREPSCELLGHRAGGSQQIVPGHDLMDHEVVQEFAHIGQDVFGTEDVAELLVRVPIRVEVFLPQRVFGCFEAVGSVPVQAMLQQFDHVRVFGERAG